MKVGCSAGEASPSVEGGDEKRRACLFLCWRGARLCLPPTAEMKWSFF
jgi:hypothetical protein